jgi:hypothetical protein
MFSSLGEITVSGSVIVRFLGHAAVSYRSDVELAVIMSILLPPFNHPFKDQSDDRSSAQVFYRYVDTLYK